MLVSGCSIGCCQKFVRTVVRSYAIRDVLYELSERILAVDRVAWVSESASKEPASHWTMEMEPFGSQRRSPRTHDHREVDVTLSGRSD